MADDNPKPSSEHTPAEADEAKSLGLDGQSERPHDSAYARSRQSGSYYTEGHEPSGVFKGRFGRSFRKNKAKYLAGGGAAALLVTFSIGMIFNFLAPFKLEFFSQNIEQVRMKRLVHIFDRRSDRFIRSLVAAEVAGDLADGENRYFRSRGWLYSSHPFTQWYRDMKVGGFLDELADKQGVTFFRNNSDQLVRMNVRGLDFDFNDMATRWGGFGVSDLTPEQAGLLDGALKQTFDGHQEGRRALNDAIDSVTRRHQLLKRRHLRKWGREALGIKKWRFFENTRDDAGRAVRKRWSDAVGKYFRNGNFVRCILGGSCPDSNNLNDADNARSLSSDAGDDISRQTGDALDEAVEEAGDRPAAEVVEEVGEQAGREAGTTMSKRIASKFIPFLNALDTIDTVRTIDNVLGDGGISKLIAVARAAEYASAFMTFNTLTDQLKKGEEVSGEEVDAMLGMLEDAEFSDGYSQVTQEQEATSSFRLLERAYARHEGDAPGQPHYAEVTENMKVNSDDTAAARIEDFYNNSFGLVFGPIKDTCEAILLCDALDAIGNVIGGVVSAGLDVFTDLTGLNPQDAITQVMARLLSALGGAPVCTGNEEGGQLFNCIDGGAAVTQEANLEATGAKPISAAAAAALERDADAERELERSQLALSEKLFSTERPDSLLAQVAMKTPGNWREFGKGAKHTFASLLPGQIFGTLKSSLLRNSDPANAASLPSNLYGVKYYGFEDAELEQEPFGGKTQQSCQTEIAKFDDAVKNGGGSQTSSICKLDEVVANTMLSMFTDADDGGLTDADDGSSPVGPISGDCTALQPRVQALIDAGTIRIQNSAARLDISECRLQGGLLSIMVAMAEQGGFTWSIGALKSDHNKCTNGGDVSNHFYGLAMDIGSAGSNLGPINQWLYDNRATLNLDELFFDNPPRKNLKGGNDTSAIGGHGDHVHVSFNGPKQAPTDHASSTSKCR